MLSEKLKSLRKQHNMTQADVAEIVGVSQQAVGKWERGIASPDYDALAKLAKRFNVSADYLIGLQSKEMAEKVEDVKLYLLRHEGITLDTGNDLQSLKRVPIIGTIACGSPILAEQNISGYTCCTDFSADFALVAKGDSMINRRIHDGDLVFIKSQPDVEDGDVTAVLIDGEATLKIIRRTDDAVMLLPANDKYPPMVFHKQDVDSFRVLGKAIGFQGRL